MFVAPYQRVFYGSFLAMSAAMVVRGIIEQQEEKQRKKVDAAAVSQAQTHAVYPYTRMWWLELAIMVFENSLFVGFVAGMASGVT